MIGSIGKNDFCIVAFVLQEQQMSPSKRRNTAPDHCGERLF
jgi:hypothetical protein